MPGICLMPPPPCVIPVFSPLSFSTFLIENPVFLIRVAAASHAAFPSEVRRLFCKALVVEGLPYARFLSINAETETGMTRMNTKLTAAVETYLTDLRRVSASGAAANTMSSTARSSPKKSSTSPTPQGTLRRYYVCMH